MPYSSNAHYAQITRGFKSALRQAGIPCEWTPAGADEPVEFSVIKNPLSPIADGVDRNDGDDAACKLTALVADLPEPMPGQGDVIEGADGLSYRISTVEAVDGLPLVSFTIQHVFKTP